MQGDHQENMKFLYIYINLYHFKIFWKYFKWDENKL